MIFIKNNTFTASKKKKKKKNVRYLINFYVLKQIIKKKRYQELTSSPLITYLISIKFKCQKR